MTILWWWWWWLWWQQCRWWWWCRRWQLPWCLESQSHILWGQTIWCWQYAFGWAYLEKNKFLQTGKKKFLHPGKKPILTATILAHFFFKMEKQILHLGIKIKANFVSHLPIPVCLQKSNGLPLSICLSTIPTTFLIVTPPPGYTIYIWINLVLYNKLQVYSKPYSIKHKGPSLLTLVLS